MLKAELVDGLFHFGVQQGIAAAPLIFGEDPSAIQRCPFCALHFDQNVDDTKWKKPPFTPLNSRGYVGKPKQKTNHILAMENNFYQARVGNRQYFTDHVINFPLGEWVVLPIVDERVVIGFPNA